MNKFCGNPFDGSVRLTSSKHNAHEVKQSLTINSHGPHGSDHRETAETYRGELFRLGRYRVVTCRDGLQWLYQKRRFEIKAVGVAWDSVGYCVSQKALARLHQAYTGTDAPEISALPFRFGKGGAK